MTSRPVGNMLSDPRGLFFALTLLGLMLLGCGLLDKELDEDGGLFPSGDSDTDTDTDTDTDADL